MMGMPTAWSYETPRKWADRVADEPDPDLRAALDAAQAEVTLTERPDGLTVVQERPEPTTGAYA